MNSGVQVYTRRVEDLWLAMSRG